MFLQKTLTTFSASSSVVARQLPAAFGSSFQAMPVVSTATSSIGACRFRSNRSKRGLYDGKDIRSGNNVSFSMRATRRKFKPNVFTKRVYSEILDEMVRFHVTASTLRSIDKSGGLDNYLLSNKEALNSVEGRATRERIVGKLLFEQREAQRATDGSEASVEADATTKESV
eukprot:Nitzschia sp. Nitz4//scaffold206_size41850//17607//18119//NITZ4_007421-RA/size41850-processed-gene-0.43-mRNA-1//1//CDS//3329541562//419//frame0